jgi:hypothetical protein
MAESAGADAVAAQGRSEQVERGRGRASQPGTDLRPGLPGQAAPRGLRVQHAVHGGEQCGHHPGCGSSAHLASYGVVKMLPGGPPAGYQGLGWEPKLAFRALADLS